MGRTPKVSAPRKVVLAAPHGWDTGCSRVRARRAAPARRSGEAGSKLGTASVMRQRTVLRFITVSPAGGAAGWDAPGGRERGAAVAAEAGLGRVRGEAAAAGALALGGELAGGAGGTQDEAERAADDGEE